MDGAIERRRAEGKLANLDALLNDSPVGGTTGIGHTRWATHGIPNERNAHPHATDRVALVHNGIIENFQELRAELEGEGRTLASDTDTDVVAHLITKYLEAGKAPVEATATALKRLEGAFALAIIFPGENDLIIGARRGSPLAIGYGDGEMYLGSDALALAPLTRRISYLEEGDWASVSAEGVQVYDATDQPVEREVKLSAMSGAAEGQGQSPPLHAQGDLRTAPSDRRYPQRLYQPCPAYDHPARISLRAGNRLEANPGRLRDFLLRRLGGQVLAGTGRSPAGRGGYRVRVSLPGR